MAQIGIDTLYRKGISFAVDIVNMRSREDHIQIAIVPICAICPSFWSCIHHLLDRLCGFVCTHRVSNSAIFGFSSQVFHFSTFLLALFFYPIHYIGFVDMQHLAYRPAACPCIVHFDCLFSDLLWIRTSFRVYRISCAALLTFAALRTRCVVPYFLLVFCFSAFRADFSCLCFYLSHSSIIS